MRENELYLINVPTAIDIKWVWVTESKHASISGTSIVTDGGIS